MEPSKDPLAPANLTDGLDMTAEVHVDPSPNQDTSMVDIIPIQNMFEITNPTTEDTKKLQEIWDYIKDTTQSDMTSERLYSLRMLENRLSRPRLGESRLGKLYNFVKVNKEIQTNEKIRDSYLT